MRKKEEKFLSTTNLAQSLSTDTREMFQRLQALNLIQRKDNTWCLTPEGLKKGGVYTTNVYGRYIVWPPSIIDYLDDEDTNSNQNLINATKIGNEFKLSRNRINSILYELGFIKRGPVKGWIVTDIGKKFGGVQEKHKTSGAPFVRWNRSILSEPILVKTISEAKGESTVEFQPESQTSNAETNFRNKSNAQIRTIDGHIVRSKAEAIIDNWLYQFRIAHAYERKLPIAEAYCDFYLPDGNVYIEYWGLDNDSYKVRRERKVEIYKQNNYNLIELYDDDIYHLDDALPRKFLEFDIRID